MGGTTINPSFSVMCKFLVVSSPAKLRTRTRDVKLTNSVVINRFYNFLPFCDFLSSEACEAM